mgnify:CR=1 FL=1|jgi:hypothetical protein
MEKLLIKLCKKFKNIYQNIILDLLIKKKQFGNNIKKCNGEETLCGIKQFKKF